MKTRDKRMVKLDFLFFSKLFFWAMYLEINTFKFGTWSFFLVQIWFTPSEGPKGFVN